MAKIFIVRSTAGEIEASELGGLKVVYAFEEKSLAESYCAKLNASGKTYKTESISDTEFSNHTIPALRAATVSAVIFNLLPDEASDLNTYSLDISRPANPRTFDFHLKRWVTAKESRHLRRVQKASTAHE